MVRCGNNPKKTTSAHPFPLVGNAVEPLVWNEPIDIDVTTADEEIVIEAVTIVESGEVTLYGSVTLLVQEFYDFMNGSLDSVKYMRDIQSKQLVCTNAMGRIEYVGELQYSLYATVFGKAIIPPQTHLMAPLEWDS